MAGKRNDFHRVSVNIPLEQLERVKEVARLRGHILLGSYLRSLMEADLAEASRRASRVVGMR